jgi:hypothetical protein
MKSENSNRTSKSSRNLEKNDKNGYRMSENPNTMNRETLHKFILNNFTEKNGLNLKRMGRRYIQNESNNLEIDDEEEYEEHNIYDDNKTIFGNLTCNPKLTDMIKDTQIVKSEICRKAYLPIPKTCDDDAHFFDLIQPKKSQNAPIKKPKPKRKTIKILKENSMNKCSNQSSSVADIHHFMNLNPSKLIPLCIESFTEKKPLSIFNTKKYFSFDEYYGLNDWMTFHGSRLRPGNFEYCKVYPKMNKIIINTSNNLLGMHYSSNRNGVISTYLYKNDQRDAIEDFAFNSALSSSDKVLDVTIKHLNQKCLRIYDCYSQKIKRKIKLDDINEHNKSKDNAIDHSNSINSDHSNQWKNYQKRNTLMHIKINQLNALTQCISEHDKESLNEISSDSNSMSRLSWVRRDPFSGSELTQLLQHNNNFIYYLDNKFNFQIFDEREMKISFKKTFSDMNYQGMIVHYFLIPRFFDG